MLNWAVNFFIIDLNKYNAVSMDIVRANYKNILVTRRHFFR